MTRTRDLAPYPAPSPKLYDEEVPRLEDQDLRDGYDKQFRINQRLKRWGIVMADLFNALDIGGWDPTTKVVWVGDGEDADYETITEALASVSPSSYDPRIIIVFPGTYFDRLYIPSHTSIYGLGQRGMVKIWVDGADNETMIEGGGENIHLANLDIQQRITSVTGTKVLELSASDVSIDNVFIENKATDKSSEVVILNNSSLTTGKKLLLNNVHIKGNNDSINQRTTTRVTDTTIWGFIWPMDDYASNYCYEIRYPDNDDHFGLSGLSTYWENAAASSPFGDGSLHYIGHPLANVFGQQVNSNIYTTATANAAAGFSRSFWYKCGKLSAGTTTWVMDCGCECGADYQSYQFIIDHSDHHLYFLHCVADGNDWPSTIYLKIDLGYFYFDTWHRYDITYDKEYIKIWIDGILVKYHHYPRTYVWSGNNRAVRVGLDGAMGHAYGDSYWSEQMALGGLLESWQFGTPAEDVATLRISSKNANTAHSLVQLNNVIVENDTPNNNIILGDVPFTFNGVISQLASGNNVSKNIVLRNDHSSSAVHHFSGVVSLFGEYSLVMDDANARVTAGRGGYHGNRPTYVPQTADANKHFEEDWTLAPSVGPISAHEFFTGNYLGDINLLYYGDIDGTGYLMPQSGAQSIKEVESHSITTDWIDAWELFARDEDFDSDYLGVMPEPPVKNFVGDVDIQGDTLTLNAGETDANSYIYFASNAYVKWDEGVNTFALSKNLTLEDGSLKSYELAAGLDTLFTCYSSNSGHAPQFYFRKSHQNTVGETTTITGEYLGKILFQGIDTNSNPQTAGQIQVRQEGAAVAGHVPARMLFFVNDGTADIEMLRLNTQGRVGIKDSSPAYDLDVNGDIAMIGSVANTDRKLYFATDAYLSWDESEDHLITTKPFALPVLADIYGGAINGSIWMEADGLHIYYNGAEKVVAGV